jgi:DNA-binding FadR family transcriptional regulator
MAVVFDKMDKVGLKERFVREIQSKIFAGELQPGDQLPSERELAAQMGISRSLVNMGILELESKGFV